jgi:hypothetical protein
MGIGCKFRHSISVLTLRIPRMTRSLDKQEEGGGYKHIHGKHCLMMYLKNEFKKKKKGVVNYFFRNVLRNAMSRCGYAPTSAAGNSAPVMRAGGTKKKRRNPHTHVVVVVVLFLNFHSSHSHLKSRE